MNKLKVTVFEIKRCPKSFYAFNESKEEKKSSHPFQVRERETMKNGLNDAKIGLIKLEPMRLNLVQCPV